jgi:hypothetical protein
MSSLYTTGLIPPTLPGETEVVRAPAPTITFREFDLEQPLHSQDISMGKQDSVSCNFNWLDQ